MKWMKQQRIGSAITDTKGNLSILGMFQIVEEAATELMGELRMDDITVKREYHAIWVFAKTKVKRLQNVGWNEVCTAVSFISKITRVSLCIDVAIKNARDELCAYARIELCALDLQTGKIRRVSTVGADDTIIAEPPMLELSFAKFAAEELPEIERHRVRSTSIDFAGHTNNKEYIRFILDTYSVRELETRPIREMEVVYSNQSYENDILTVRKGSFQNKDIILVQKENQIIVKSEITTKI